MVDEHDLAARAAGDVGAGEDADHPAGVVGDDRFALRTRDEVLGGLGQERLGTHREHVGVHQVADRVRERDEPRGGVGVVRRDDQGGHPAFGRVRPRRLRDGSPPVEIRQRRAGLECERLRAQAVADDDGVSGPDARGERRGLCRSDEHVTGDRRGGVADDERAVERAHELLDGDRHALEALDLGLVEVARGKRALADEPERAALAVDDRQPAHRVLAHRPTGDQHRLVRADRDRIGRHDVAHARAHVGDLLGQLDAEALEHPHASPGGRSQARRRRRRSRRR